MPEFGEFFFVGSSLLFNFSGHIDFSSTVPLMGVSLRGGVLRSCTDEGYPAKSLNT